MGLEKNGAALLLKIRSEGVRFGRALTLGRQNLHLELGDYCRLCRKLGLTAAAEVPKFCDQILISMGATSVDSLDFAAYEGANIIHDLNQPVSSELHERYDIVFDGGTLEHIFDFPTAIENCMRMLKGGGHFISVTMPNNWCGHGFYQFSPELFYRVLSKANGFSVVEMYIARLEGFAYSVRDPEVVRGRVELCNAEPLYLLVHAKREVVCDLFVQPPQQSDYLTDWSRVEEKSNGKQASRWKMYPVIRHLRQKRAAREVRRYRSLKNQALYLPANLSI